MIPAASLATVAQLSGIEQTLVSALVALLFVALVVLLLQPIIREVFQ